MKNKILIACGLVVFCLFCVANPAKAQKKVTFEAQTSQISALSLNFEFADTVRFLYWNQDKIKVEATVNIDSNRYNDKFGFESQQRGKSLSVKSKIKDFKEIASKKNNFRMQQEFRVWLPKNKTINFESICANVEMKDFSGNWAIKTISGFIDITLPASGNFDIDMSTISGGIYSDLEILSDNNRKSLVGQKVQGKLNGGGDARLRLETISGNIYLRKQK